MEFGRELPIPGREIEWRHGIPTRLTSSFRVWSEKILWTPSYMKRPLPRISVALLIKI
jgi:hypothetical protein